MLRIWSVNPRSQCRTRTGYRGNLGLRLSHTWSISCRERDGETNERDELASVLYLSLPRAWRGHWQVLEDLLLPSISILQLNRSLFLLDVSPWRGLSKILRAERTIQQRKTQQVSTSYPFLINRLHYDPAVTTRWYLLEIFSASHRLPKRDRGSVWKEPSASVDNRFDQAPSHPRYWCLYPQHPHPRTLSLSAVIASSLPDLGSQIKQQTDKEERAMGRPTEREVACCEMYFS